MTISNNTTRSTYTAGNSTVFTYDFRILDQSDLKVVQADTAGTETTLTIGTDYTVSGVGDASGNVTITKSLNSTDTIQIILDPELEQTLDLTAAGPFPAESFESALDRTVNLVKRVYDLLTRSLTLTDGSATTNGTFDALNGTITNVTNPSSAQDVATKAYVDAQIAASEISGNVTVSSFGATLIDDANASVALDTLGFSALGKSLIDDTTGSAALVTLGMFPYTVSGLLTLSTASGWRDYLGVPDIVRMENRLINGDFQLWQPNGGTFDSTSPNDDGEYFADQWVFLTEAGSGNDTVDFQKDAVAGYPFGLLEGARGGAVATVNDPAYQFGVLQILDANESLRLRNSSVHVSFYAAGGSDLTGLRVHLVSWDTNFTADQPTVDFISAWNGSTAAPTPITNVDLLTADGGSTFTVNGTYAKKSFTFSGANAVPADCQHLGIFIGTNDSSFSANATLGLTAIKITQGADEFPFVSRPREEELRRAQRFYTKSFPVDTKPAAGLGVSTAGFHGFCMDEGGSSGGFATEWRFPVEMVKAPTITSYNSGNASASAGTWHVTTRAEASVSDRTLLTSNATVHRAAFGADGGGGTDRMFAFDAVADARY